MSDSEAPRITTDDEKASSTSSFLDRGKSLFNSAKDKSAEVASKAKAASSEAADKAKIMSNDAVQKASKYTSEKRDAFQAYMRKKKEQMHNKVLSVMDRAVDSAVDKTMRVVKRNLIDDDMPRFVKRTIDSAVDEITPDVKEEVMLGVRGTMTRDLQRRQFEKIEELEAGRKQKFRDRRRQLCCCCAGFLTWLRGYLLYTLYPYDRSFWMIIRRPLWWLITIAKLIPVVGISQTVFFIIFFLKNKTDEYQLVKFIIDFKGLMCISGFLVNAIIGAAMYYRCANTNGSNTCNEEGQGPGVTAYTYIECAFFVVQIFFAWTAFFLLPYSQKLGGWAYQKDALRAIEKQHAAQGGNRVHPGGTATPLPSKQQSDQQSQNEAKQKKKDEEAEDMAMKRFGPAEEPIGRGCFGKPKYAGRGGRLMGLLVYDTIVFLIICALALWALFDRSTGVQDRDSKEFRDQEWTLKATLWWLRVVYAGLMFPYLPFALPVVFSLLSHARPTGYTRLALCVPMLPTKLRKEQREKERKAREEEEKRALRPTDGDIDQALEADSEGDGDDDSDKEKGNAKDQQEDKRSSIQKFFSPISPSGPSTSNSTNASSSPANQSKSSNNPYA